MLQRLFAALENFPSHSQSWPDFDDIVTLLYVASWGFKSPLSLRVTREVVVQGIPTVLRETKSISLALSILQGVVKCFWSHLDLSDQPYVTLDKVMLELFSKQNGVEGCTEENLSSWKEIRSRVMREDRVDLDNLNGSLPIWNPSATRTGPSRLDGFLSVLGIDRVCISRALQYVSHSYRPCIRVPWTIRRTSEIFVWMGIRLILCCGFLYCCFVFLELQCSLIPLVLFDVYANPRIYFTPTIALHFSVEFNTVSNSCQDFLWENIQWW